MNTLSNYENIALSNKDILYLLDGKANIVMYPDLYKYNNIDEILDPYGACILLFESKPKYGHWCAIFKTSNTTLEFFNPYGGYPDDSLEYIPMHFREISNQLYPYLTILMINSPYQLSYNEIQFQKHNKNIKTCGRHCVVRLLYRYLSLYEYYNDLKNLSDDTGYNFDQLVTLLTS